MIKDFLKIKRIIAKFKKLKIMVIGDLILDEFLWGDVERISPEAPVPVVWVRSESFMPGGASNVANNIASLGAKVYLSGITGKDRNADILVAELEKRGINLDGVVVDGQRPTTLKTRIIAHHQQVVRVDRERLDSIDDNMYDQMFAFINKKIKEVDAIIIEDYGKGLVTSRLLSRLIPLVKRHKKIITVDPKVDHFSYYKGVSSITPNLKEAQEISGLKAKTESDIDKIGRKILKELNSESVLLTLGEGGMRLFEKNGKIIHIPTMAQDVFDVSGAGDTVIAAFTLGLSCGINPRYAAYIANYAAGIVVGKVGVATVTSQELLERIKGVR